MVSLGLVGRRVFRRRSVNTGVAVRRIHSVRFGQLLR